jgi:hypothetical protein
MEWRSSSSRKVIIKLINMCKAAACFSDMELPSEREIVFIFSFSIDAREN